ncbi:MAG: TonB family protein [Longimicrobiales bacterium]
MSVSSGPSRKAVIGSVALHAAIVSLFLFARAAQPKVPPMQAYRVSIVSPPPQALGDVAPAVAEQEPATEPEPPEPEPQAVPVPETQREAPPEREPEPTPEPEATPAQPSEAQPTRGDRPDPRSAGGQDLEVNIEGEAFPYPEYLENIILQVRRYFRWAGAPGLEAEVYFVIRSDGSVEDLRITRSSGNRQFDFQALGAVEVAGNRGAFGSLPDGFGGDRLPVRFFIDSR